jgi:hypothetical protein
MYAAINRWRRASARRCCSRPARAIGALTGDKRRAALTVGSCASLPDEGDRESDDGSGIAKSSFLGAGTNRAAPYLSVVAGQGDGRHRAEISAESCAGWPQRRRIRSLAVEDAHRGELTKPLPGV